METFMIKDSMTYEEVFTILRKDKKFQKIEKAMLEKAEGAAKLKDIFMECSESGLVFTLKGVK